MPSCSYGTFWDYDHHSLLVIRSQLPFGLWHGVGGVTLGGGVANSSTFAVQVTDASSAVASVMITIEVV